MEAPIEEEGNTVLNLEMMKLFVRGMEKSNCNGRRKGRNRRKQLAAVFPPLRGWLEMCLVITLCRGFKAG
jgi:hypothetical protein